MANGFARLLANPRRLRRLGYWLVGVASLLAGVATGLRGRVTAGSDAAGATYLLDALAWLVAVAGAVAEARVGSLLAAFDARPARRRALGLTIGGVSLTLVACILLSDLLPGRAPLLVRAVVAAALVGGLGLGLGGLVTLAAVDGLRYAAGRFGADGE